MFKHVCPLKNSVVESKDGSTSTLLSTIVRASGEQLARLAG
jgi:hypothetical protein